MATKPVPRAVLGDLTNVARTKTSAINKRSIKSRILNVTKNRGITKRTSGGRAGRVASKNSQGVTSTTSLEEQHRERLEEEERCREEQCRQRLEAPQVEDIDARDRENPQVCSEYAAQIYSHLRQLEGRYQLPRDPLAGLPVTGRMRAVLADWLVEAAASLHLSLLLLAPGPRVWSSTLQHYSGYTAAQLQSTVSLLAAMMSMAPTTRLQAVRTKYRDSKFHRVSLLPQLERCSQLASLFSLTG